MTGFSTGTAPECSPLSCNGLAAEMAVKEAQRRGGNQVVLASIPFGMG